MYDFENFIDPNTGEDIRDDFGIVNCNYDNSQTKYTLYRSNYLDPQNEQHMSDMYNFFLVIKHRPPVHQQKNYILNRFFFLLSITLL